MRFFIFYFILFFLLQLVFASTHMRNQKWLKSFNFRIFRNQTGFYTFLSSHVLKFFQNSKLSSFFVVKMKKNNNFKKKNESPNFAKSNAHRKTNAGGSFETQNFFFSLINTLLACNFSKRSIWEYITGKFWVKISFILVYNDAFLWCKSFQCDIPYKHLEVQYF